MVMIKVYPKSSDDWKIFGPFDTDMLHYSDNTVVVKDNITGKMTHFFMDCSVLIFPADNADTVE